MDFQRVLDIAELPDFLEDHKLIDTPKLIRARASSELRDFRKWLPTIKSSSDSQIKDAVAGLRAKLGLKIGGTVGKAIRVLITAGTIVKSLPGSIALSA